MTATFALTPSTSANTSGQMRPLNILRDLPAVADLIELCFSNTLDSDGRNYIEQMRRNGNDTGFLSWVPRVVESVSLPLSGFVWEDNGRIVGNVSLVPFSKGGLKIFLLANIATHPDYRRRGIARALTKAAMQRAHAKGASTVWLQVRHDNPGAIALYHELGFYERTRRTTWQAFSSGTLLSNRRTTAIRIRPRSLRDWPQQNRWLEISYPPSLDWYFAHRWKILQPGLVHDIYRFLADIDTLQWAAYKNNRLGAVLSYQRVAERSDYLWLAAPRHPDPEIITELLLYGRYALSEHYSLTLEFPAGIADEAIAAAGFRPQRTLIWMAAQGVQPQ